MQLEIMKEQTSVNPKHNQEVRIKTRKRFFDGKPQKLMKKILKTSVLFPNFRYFPHCVEILRCSPSMLTKQSVHVKNHRDISIFVLFRPHKMEEENHDLCCVFFIFRPHIMGEENHDLCCVFLQIMPNLHDLHQLLYYFYSYW